MSTHFRERSVAGMYPSTAGTCRCLGKHKLEALADTVPVSSSGLRHYRMGCLNQASRTWLRKRQIGFLRVSQGYSLVVNTREIKITRLEMMMSKRKRLSGKARGYEARVLT